MHHTYGGVLEIVGAWNRNMPKPAATHDPTDSADEPLPPEGLRIINAPWRESLLGG
jgi:hypothetical protein